MCFFVKLLLKIPYLFLMKMKFDKYGELLDYLFKNIEKNPYIKPGIQNNYPELEVASSLKSSLKKEQESFSYS